MTMSNALRSGLLAAVPLLAAPAPADEVLRWNAVATEAAAAAQTDPLTESRIFAMVHVAIHDALNSIEHRYQTSGEPLAAEAGASAEAAVAAAAHATLSALLPAGRPAYDAALAGSPGPAGPGARAGADVGRRAAERTLAGRRHDGASRTVAYAAGQAPGGYRPTPPDFTAAFMAHWGSVTPFVLRSADQFRPLPPPRPGSASAQADLEEVRHVGAKEGATRSGEQDEIARYWYENSTQGWNRIARVVARERGLDLWQSGRLLALVNVAMADGFIAGFEAKYHYAYWRTATAIREAGHSGWLSYLDTPPVPDHPSTHTVLGAAAAAVLARFFGTDFVPFEMTSGAPYPGLTRRFWSFSEAAQENGASRVLAGIHFPTAVRAGYVQGQQVGAWAFDNAFRPVAPPDDVRAARR